MSGDRLNDILDGVALWQEHRPQTAEDWIGVAERCLADPDFDRAKSSVMFAALVTAVEKRDGALARLDSGAAEGDA